MLLTKEPKQTDFSCRRRAGRLANERAGFRIFSATASVATGSGRAVGDSVRTRSGFVFFAGSAIRTKPSTGSMAVRTSALFVVGPVPVRARSFCQAVMDASASDGAGTFGLSGFTFTDFSTVSAAAGAANRPAPVSARAASAANAAHSIAGARSRANNTPKAAQPPWAAADHARRRLPFFRKFMLLNPS